MASYTPAQGDIITLEFDPQAGHVFSTIFSTPAISPPPLYIRYQI